jgi:hypothetical protein
MSEVPTPRPGMACSQIASLATLGTFSSGFKQNAALFAAVWRWRGEASCHWGQAPLLHVCFDEDESHLSKVDMHRARPICSNRWKEVLGFEVVGNVVKLLPVSSKEDGSSPWPISYANHVTLCELRRIICGGKRLVISPVTR